ncbi:MAG: hypothetical protein LQ337_003594 [Flavoplaca oasis]|nr:MAG: hypothetical protein LQ337_003594 [Flavoplaca oasis]
MSTPNTQDARPPGVFENVVRGMILGHDLQQPVEPGASASTSRTLQDPALQIPTPCINQHAPRSGRDQDAAKITGRSQDKQSNATGQKPQPRQKKDQAAASPGDALAEYTLRQARQPRRRQAAGPSHGTTAGLGSAAPGISRTVPRSRQQPPPQLQWTPPPAMDSQVRLPKQPWAPHGLQTQQSHPPQQRDFQPGNQHTVPTTSSYGRPPAQNQHLYDPRATSQQVCSNSAMRGGQSKRFISAQSHHQIVQAQTNYLDSVAHSQIPKVAIALEEEQRKEALREVLEDICQKTVTEYEVIKDPLFDGSTVSLRCFGSLRTGFATRLSDMDLVLGSPKSIPDPALPESGIPRMLEKAFLELGYGARLLTRTRVPIIRFCEMPTPDLAARLREERAKWEKEDAATRNKKAKDTDAANSVQKKKSKGGRGNQGKEKASVTQHEDEQLKSRKQICTVSSGGQVAEVDGAPTMQVADENAFAEDTIQHGLPWNESTARHEDVIPTDRRYSTENPAIPAEATSSSHKYSEKVPAHDLDINRHTEASRDADSTDRVTTDLEQMSMTTNPGSPEEASVRVSKEIESQKPESGEKAIPGPSRTVDQAPEPRSRLELTLTDEEIVRLYRLAIQEGWFEPAERGIIFAYIKAFESKSNQDQLVACRSQLLALPDVLNRYRPPPEHHLDFPKDGVGVQCDINFSNRLALHNSHMLRCYSLSDARVRPMVLFVKAWAKRRNINSPYHGTLSSYGYVLMVLHYLVNIARPPICLNLQTIDMAQRDSSTENTQIVDGYSVRFWRNENEIQQWAKDSRITADHHSSVGSLLRGFYQYFAVVSGGFSWGTDVLSLRTPGGILSKKQKDWVAAKTVVLEPVAEGQKGQEVRQRYLCAIEDPFEINHNIARTVVHNGIVAIRDEFRRANRLIHEAGNGKISEDLFEEAEAKDDLNYRHFGPRPRPPPQTKAAAPASSITNSDGKQSQSQVTTGVE